LIPSTGARQKTRPFSSFIPFTSAHKTFKLYRQEKERSMGDLIKTQLNRPISKLRRYSKLADIYHHSFSIINIPIFPDYT